VQDDGQGLGVGSKDGKLAGSTVDSLGDYNRKKLATIGTADSRGISKHTFVGTLLSLTDVHSRLEEIQNLLGQGRIGQGPSCKKKQNPLAQAIEKKRMRAMAYLLHWRLTFFTM
jgi:hypothetical protein